mmetsp:Transcript_26538/g.66780  ORF Transcript_26538/g.66780 Transcript_26538/m.66780 type:complete len:80 (-) Transcript_26538:81-320(-)
MDIDGVDFSGEDLLADELVDDINTDEVIDDADLTMDDLLDPSALTDTQHSLKKLQINQDKQWILMELISAERIFWPMSW